MPAPFPSSKNYAYTYGSEADADLTENEARSEVPSVAVAELKGHEEGPIHIVRFTGESIIYMIARNALRLLCSLKTFQMLSSSDWQKRSCHLGRRERICWFRDTVLTITIFQRS